jgi:hypothetical protein
VFFCIRRSAFGVRGAATGGKRTVLRFESRENCATVSYQQASRFASSTPDAPEQAGTARLQ